MLRIEVYDDTPAPPIVRRANMLGYAGLIPFALAAIVLWLSPWIFPTRFAGVAMQWEMYYAAIILSFMGGARWGLAMLEPSMTLKDNAGLARLSGSVAPALIAWLALVPDSLVPFGSPGYAVRHAILVFAFLYLLDSDLRAVKAGAAPEWYAPLRRKLTFFVALLMTLIILRLLMWGW